MNRRKYLATAGSATVALVAGCASTPSGSDGEETSPTDADYITATVEETVSHTFSPGLEASDFGWTDEELDYGAPGVRGTISNVGSERLAKAGLAVDFYDGDTQIGTNTSWATYLEPDEYGALEAPYTGDDPARVTRVAITSNVLVDSLRPLNDGVVAVDSGELSTDENGWAAVEGTVENRTLDRLPRVTISVNFYGGEELIGSGRDVVSRLPSEAQAEWEATTDQAGADALTRYAVVTTYRPSE